MSITSQKALGKNGKRVSMREYHSNKIKSVFCLCSLNYLWCRLRYFYLFKFHFILLNVYFEIYSFYPVSQQPLLLTSCVSFHISLMSIQASLNNNIVFPYSTTKITFHMHCFCSFFFFFFHLTIFLYPSTDFFFFLLNEQRREKKQANRNDGQG